MDRRVHGEPHRAGCAPRRRPPPGPRRVRRREPRGAVREFSGRRRESTRPCPHLGRGTCVGPPHRGADVGPNADRDGGRLADIRTGVGRDDGGVQRRARHAAASPALRQRGNARAIAARGGWRRPTVCPTQCDGARRPSRTHGLLLGNRRRRKRQLHHHRGRSRAGRRRQYHCKWV